VEDGEHGQSSERRLVAAADEAKMLVASLDDVTAAEALLDVLVVAGERLEDVRVGRKDDDVRGRRRIAVDGLLLLGREGVGSVGAGEEVADADAVLAGKVGLEQLAPGPAASGRRADWDGPEEEERGEHDGDGQRDVGLTESATQLCARTHAGRNLAQASALRWSATARCPRRTKNRESMKSQMSAKAAARTTGTARM